jgi:hypothetical protein
MKICIVFLRQSRFGIIIALVTNVVIYLNKHALSQQFQQVRNVGTVDLTVSCDCMKTINRGWKTHLQVGSTMRVLLGGPDSFLIDLV